VHGDGGTMTITERLKGEQPGIQLDFDDQGAGIPDLGQAMTDGYSTAGSLGLGLGGARRLVSEFDIISRPGHGTRISVIQWKRR